MHVFYEEQATSNGTLVGRSSFAERAMGLVNEANALKNQGFETNGFSLGRSVGLEATSRYHSGEHGLGDARFADTAAPAWSSPTRSPMVEPIAYTPPLLSTRERNIESKVEHIASVDHAYTASHLSARERNLESRAMLRVRSFGSLQHSWLVKNCFAAWRSLFHLKVVAKVQEAETEEYNVIRELQIALADKERIIEDLRREYDYSRRRDRVTYRGLTVHAAGGVWERMNASEALLLQKWAFSAFQLIACQSHLARRMATLEREQSMRIAELESQHSAFVSEQEAHHTRKLVDLETELEENSQSRFLELRSLHSSHVSELEAKHQKQLAELEAELVDRAETRVADLLARHKSHTADLEARHATRISELELHIAELEAAHRSRFEEAEAIHQRSLCDLKDMHASHISELESKHSRHAGQLHEDWQARLRRLELQRHEAVRSVASTAATAKIVGHMRTVMAVVFAAWARCTAEGMLESTWDARLRRERSELEQEWRVKHAEKEEELRRLRLQWEARLRESEEDRDARLREAELELSTRSRDLESQLRLAEAAHLRLEQEHARKLREHHDEFHSHKREWESKLSAAEAAQLRLQQEHDRRLREAQQELHGSTREWEAQLSLAEAARLRLEQEHAKQLEQTRDELHCQRRDWESELHGQRRDFESQISFAEAARLRLEQEHERQLHGARNELASHKRDLVSQLDMAEAAKRLLEQEKEAEAHRLHRDWEAKAREREASLRKELELERAAQAAEYNVVVSDRGSRAALALAGGRLRVVASIVFTAWSRCAACAQAEARLAREHEHLLQLQAAEHRAEVMRVHEEWEARWGEADRERQSWVEERSQLMRSLDRNRNVDSVSSFAMERTQAKEFLHRVILSWHAVAVRARAMSIESKAEHLTATAQERVLLTQVLTVWWRLRVEARWAYEMQRLDSERDQHRVHLSFRTATVHADFREKEFLFLIASILDKWWHLCRHVRCERETRLVSQELLRARNQHQDLAWLGHRRSNREFEEWLLASSFGAWKGQARDSREHRLQRHRAARRLEVWGRKYGDARSSVLWHRVFAMWRLSVKLEQWRYKLARITRHNVVRSAEKALRLRDACTPAFVVWFMQSVVARLKRTSEGLTRELVLVRLSASSSRELMVSASWNLRQYNAMHAMFSRWKIETCHARWGVKYEEQERRLRSVLLEKAALCPVVAHRAWDAQTKLLVHAVFTAWRQRVLGLGTERSLEHLRGMVSSLRSRAVNRLGQNQPLALQGRVLVAWHRAVLEGHLRRHRESHEQRGVVLLQEIQEQEHLREVLLLKSSLARWRMFTANVTHARTLEVLRGSARGSNSERVRVVVSAIEDQLRRLIVWQCFRTWAHVVRIQPQLLCMQVPQIVASAPRPVLSRVLCVGQPEPHFQHYAQPLGLQRRVVTVGQRIVPDLCKAQHIRVQRHLQAWRGTVVERQAWRPALASTPAWASAPALTPMPALPAPWPPQMGPPSSPTLLLTAPVTPQGGHTPRMAIEPVAAPPSDAFSPRTSRRTATPPPSLLGGGGWQIAQQQVVQASGLSLRPAVRDTSRSSNADHGSGVYPSRTGLGWDAVAEAVVPSAGHSHSQRSGGPSWDAVADTMVPAQQVPGLNGPAHSSSAPSLLQRPTMSRATTPPPTTPRSTMGSVYVEAASISALGAPSPRSEAGRTLITTAKPVASPGAASSIRVTATATPSPASNQSHQSKLSSLTLAGLRLQQG